MAIARRTNTVVGYVNFPVDSKEFVSTCEGGLFVELWVIPKDKKDWMVCCGGHSITTMYTDSLVGTDVKRNKDTFDKGNFHATQRFPLEEDLFLEITDNKSPNQCVSKYLYACVTLGSTGWSGYHKTKGMWRCTFNDLNDDGKSLYKLLEKLYGDKATLRLVTWLDT